MFISQRFKTFVGIIFREYLLKNKNTILMFYKSFNTNIHVKIINIYYYILTKCFNTHQVCTCLVWYCLLAHCF